MTGQRRTLAASAALLFLWIGAARADPWLGPGDVALRSDIELLADAGILRGPVTTWPISWPDIARDVLVRSPGDFDENIGQALLRVQRMARAASATGFDGAGVRASAAYDPIELRGFEETPREEGEIAVRASWLSNHFALNLQGAAVANPDDGQRFRADGSYVGVNVGNFMISVGYVERWWGPGWDTSLILSTNARPIPSLTLERNYSDPFKTRLLSWIGPWRASIAVGESDEDDLEVPHVRFLAARVTVRPKPWLEMGLSRTAQWCGGDRPCGWGVFTDMLIGKDNQFSNGRPTADQPGNQMAGYDLRLRSPWRKLPVVFFTQWIGEDEAGGFPSKFLGMFGMEAWGSNVLGGWRMRAEYADTACNFSRQNPQFDCAYRNTIYPQGYTNWGRVIGSSLDNDSRLYSLSGVLTLSDGDSLSLSLRRAELNRDGGTHVVSNVPLDLDNVELRLSHALGAGRVGAGIGYGDPGDRVHGASGVHGFVTWQQGF